MTSELARQKVTLVGGPRGSGKTRGLLRVAAGIARELGRPVLWACLDSYGPGEARRWLEEMGLERELPAFAFLATGALEELAAAAETIKPALVVVDAFRLATIAGVACDAGTPAERAAADLLSRVAASADAAMVLVLHNQASQKAYSVGGPVLQACAAIFRFDPVPEGHPCFGAPRRAIVLSCDEKNRCGPAERRALLEMDDRGALDLHPSDREVP